jgi:tetratricopeptide (TPR) repeat protein
MLSTLFLNQGDFQKARDEAQKALSVDRDNPSTLNVVGNVELFAEKYPLAGEHFKKALDRPVRLGDFTFRTNEAGLGFSLVKLGREAEGLKLLARIRSIDVKNIEKGSETTNLRYELAAISAVEGKGREACDWLQKAIDLGWRDYRFAQRDPMFESLRHDERFIRMMNDVKKRVDEQRTLVREMEKQ